MNSGSSAGFSASVTGSGELAYQWFFNDQPIPGANSAALAIVGIQPSQAGFYFLRATNLLGTANSAVASLTVDGSIGSSSGVRTLQLPIVQSGTLTVQFSTRDGSPAAAGQLAGLRVQGSSDLVGWVDIPAIVSVVGDRFQISVNDPAVLPYRFYRVIYP